MEVQESKKEKELYYLIRNAIDKNKELDKNDFLKNDGNEIQSCEDFNN